MIYAVSSQTRSWTSYSAGARTEEEIVGLIPPDDGWRAQTRQPDVLPWFPMVSHRGGFPNGS